ncbi:MAG TPA: hypothetical protein VEQ87_07415, partial [Burkholderiales bacterium]|nr:hypothetical protein [Burkholderiales bacterium]
MNKLLRRPEARSASALKTAAYTPFEPSAAWVSAWTTSEIAAREEATFSENEDSLQSWKSRAFLYHCIRAMKPATVVEIG